MENGHCQGPAEVAEEQVRTWALPCQDPSALSPLLQRALGLDLKLEGIVKVTLCHKACSAKSSCG